MKKYVILALIAVAFSQATAQTYKKLTDSALHVMWNARDTVEDRRSLNLYELAFKQFPKDIEYIGLYKAAVLSGTLKEYDKAFYFLESVLALNTEANNTFNIIINKYAASEYKNLLTDSRWAPLAARAQKMHDAYFNKIKEKEEEFKQTKLQWNDFSKQGDGKSTYQKIISYNDFKAKKQRNYSIKFKVTDSLMSSYFVSLPAHYNPKKSYPILFFLHGAVQGNNLTEYQDARILEGWNRYYTKYADINQVIMVYPKGSRQYNWMAPDAGFFMIQAILKEIKQSINIDDNKVFITGHSNGATGSFSYLMKQQSPFAGFYGFNTQPVVRTGGTFLKNITNRYFFNISTDQDYYFPPAANDSLNIIMKSLKADYQDHRYNGFPHWFPQFDESEPVYPQIFSGITNRSRNPFHENIYWECDDVKYGTADWVQINALDTLSKPAKWHKTLNFNIYNMLSYDKDKNLISKDTLLKAFKFPRKSGAVTGYYKNNQFHLEVSAVKAVTVFISPEMVDMRKPVVIYINGIKKAEKKPVYDRDFILANFKETYDRKAVWVDKIQILL